MLLHRSPHHSMIQVEEGALVCCDATLDGNFDIIIRPGCVIHPKCLIRAAAGPIEIGCDCIIEEFASIENVTEGSTLVLGRGNLVRVGGLVHCSIGNDNIVEVKAQLGPSVVVGSSCVVATGSILENQTMEDSSVAFTLKGKVQIRNQMKNFAQQTDHENYLGLLRNPENRCSILKHHKVLPHTV